MVGSDTGAGRAQVGSNRVGLALSLRRLPLPSMVPLLECVKRRKNCWGDIFLLPLPRDLGPVIGVPGLIGQFTAWLCWTISTRQNKQRFSFSCRGDSKPRIKVGLAFMSLRRRVPCLGLDRVRRLQGGACSRHDARTWSVNIYLLVAETRRSGCWPRQPAADELCLLQPSTRDCSFRQLFACRCGTSSVSVWLAGKLVPAERHESGAAWRRARSKTGSTAERYAPTSYCGIMLRRMP